jgi:hypothetical protein
MNYLFFFLLCGQTLAEPIFRIQYLNQLCTWQYQQQPACDFRPPNSPYRIAVDGSTVYWITNGTPTRIFSHNATVSEQLIYTSNSTSKIIALYVNSGYLYFSSTNSQFSLWRMPLTGGAPEGLCTTPMDAFVLSDAYVYFVSNYQLVKAPLSKCSLQQIVALQDTNATAPTTVCPEMAVDPTLRRIYMSYGNNVDARVYYASLDATDQSPVYFGDGMAKGLVFAEGFLYSFLTWGAAKKQSPDGLYPSVQRIYITNGNLYDSVSTTSPYLSSSSLSSSSLSSSSSSTTGVTTGTAFHPPSSMDLFASTGTAEQHTNDQPMISPACMVIMLILYLLK